MQHAMQGLLVAYELRERLLPKWLPRSEAPSVNKVLEAITHRSCEDSIDFERYELLGDAFLKFATANSVYNSGKKTQDEGGMSLELHRRVSNGTLWRCAKVWSAVRTDHPVPCCFCTKAVL
jgi:endoribonuclease Dicer